MGGREIMRSIMALKGITNTMLASRLGITPAALWDRIDTQPRKGKPRKDIPVSLLSDMVKVMDYKIMIVPSNTRLPKDGYLIETAEDSDS